MSDDDIRNLLDDTLKRARQLGADEANVVYTRSEDVTAEVRGREGENKILRTDSTTISLEVYVGKRTAQVSLSTLRPDDLREAVAEVVAAAKTMPENKWAGLADPSEIARSWPDLDLYDSTRSDETELMSSARAAEGLALLQPKVVSSEGGAASWSDANMIVMATNGFNAAIKRSSSSIVANVIASENGKSEMAYDYSQARHRSDLRSALLIGQEAGRKAARMLGAREPKTGLYPVVFHPEVAASLLEEFVAAANGEAVTQEQTFLRDKMGEQVFGAGITIKDNPHIRRGIGSRPFDGDGVPTQPLTLVENGVLKSWLLDLESARELGLKNTGHAARGWVSNLFMQAGSVSPEELIADIGEGFYVMQLMGHGANTLTGDFSQGASGLWIKNGKLAYPVSGATVAGTLQHMFLNAVPANDLDIMKNSVTAPTLRLPVMTVSGQ